MSYWIKFSEDEAIPDWLKSELRSDCQYCYSEMEHYYNDDFVCTNRRCSNPKCVSFSAAKANFMVKHLGIKGYGFAKCKDLLMEYPGKHYLRLLPILTGGRPRMSIISYLRIHCFPGIDGEWEKICKTNNIYTLDELYERYEGKHMTLLNENKELLYENLQYVELEERPENSANIANQFVLTIMITGTPNGFDSKEDFINFCNKHCRGYISIIHQATKKQSGVNFLIREPGSKTKGKVEAALKGGIPIVTSAEFIALLNTLLDRIKT